jgi:hypothetical protein
MRGWLVSRTNSFVAAAVHALAIIPRPAQAADEPALTRDQIKEFLQTAKVINSKQTAKGVTNPWRLTLTNGTITHDASFQPIDEHKMQEKLQSGQVEFNFADSYKYNIAAHRLAELFGVEDM